MSLVSLTFGSNRQQMSVGKTVEVIRPWDSIRIDPAVENRLEVKKVSTFLNFDFPYIIGEILQGAVCEGMKGTCNGIEFTVEEVNSKYGSIAKAGMTIGIVVKGISKEQINAGEVITLMQ